MNRHMYAVFNLQFASTIQFKHQKCTLMMNKKNVYLFTLLPAAFFRFISFVFIFDYYYLPTVSLSLPFIENQRHFQWVCLCVIHSFNSALNLVLLINWYKRKSVTTSFPKDYIACNNNCLERKMMAINSDWLTDTIIKRINGDGWWIRLKFR